MSKNRLAPIAIVTLLLGLTVQPGQSAPVVAGTYYEHTGVFNCPTSFTCTLLFAPLPAQTQNQFVVLDEISCILSATTGLLRAQLFVSDGGVNPRRRRGLNVPVTEASAIAFNNQVHFKIAGGAPRTVSASFTAIGLSTDFNGQCTIVGTISPD